ncbi:glycoside hydrolase family 2 protein [Sphingobacteriaceae bacterium]|nr:glycoside hydrolase family 2 protein [Sphingobacteriaceae bacterium]
MIKKIFLFSVFSLALSGTSQTQWPTITQANKPWTRWWWEGSGVDKEGLSAAMKLYQQAGLGGLEITPIYGVKGAEDKFLNFLTPQWTEMLQYTLNEAAKLNLGIDMATGTGWPFGGPWVKPADACKNIHLKTYSLKEGEELKDTIYFTQKTMVRTVSGKPVDITTLSYPIATNKNLQTCAFDQVVYPIPLDLHVLMAYSDKGVVIDLTKKVNAKGKLNWKAPKGNWNLYALFMGWHGKQVERAAPGGEGDVIDHFNEQALKNYLSEFDKAFKGKDLSGLRSFFNDSYEVDDARGQSNWTPEFFKEFSARRGYDLRNELPSLYQIEKSEKTARVLYDYRLTISELLLEKFTKPWHTWAKEKGKLIRNQSHGSPANILDLYDAIDIPETEGKNAMRFKFATSAANVSGKPLASAEASTWLNEHFVSKLSDVKKNLDDYFVGGVNHIFYHGTNYSPQNDAWPGWLFYAAVHFTPSNPFWKDFGTLNNYVAHCQSFLQKGKSDNDVLVYFPYNDKISEVNNEADYRQTYSEHDPKHVSGFLYHFDGMNGFEKTDFKTSSDMLLEKGYTFDFISDKQLELTTSTGGLLETTGNSYKTILLSNTKYISLQTFTKLADLVKSGATVIFYKDSPSLVPGLSHLKKNQAGLDALLKQLNYSKTSVTSIQQAVLGKGKFIKGDDLSELLKFASVSRESLADKGLGFVRRKLGTGHYYFITNSGTNRINDYVSIESKGATVVLFDPMFERKGLAKIKKDDGGKIEVFLQLEPGESCILQVTPTIVNDVLFPYSKSNGSAEVLKGKWIVKFLSGGPVLPASYETENPAPWTAQSAADYQNFSGTAEYSTTFDKPTTNSEAYQLDLGKVEESAEVILNGKKMATLIGPNYKVIIPAASLQDNNQLQIVVTNGMANRIIDLEKRGVEWKKFYNVNFPAHDAENRNKDNLFTAKSWTVRPSGLTEKVTLSPITLEHKP